MEEPIRILCTQNVDRSIEFYKKIFGFEVRYQQTKNEGIEYALLKSIGVSVWIATRQTIAALRPNFPWPDHFESPLALEVVDLRTEVERLRSLRVKQVEMAKPRASGRAQALFEDPDGNRIEIRQRIAGAVPDGPGF